jgi:hypothetical protein
VVRGYVHPPRASSLLPRPRGFSGARSARAPRPGQDPRTNRMRRPGASARHGIPLEPTTPPQATAVLFALVIDTGKVADACAMVRDYRDRLTFLPTKIEIPASDDVATLMAWANAGDARRNDAAHWRVLNRKFGTVPGVAFADTRCAACKQAITRGTPIMERRRHPQHVDTHFINIERCLRRSERRA